MFTASRLIIESPIKRHFIFCIAVLTILFLGLYFFYIAGFRFTSPGIIGLNFILFLLYIYAGRWLCLKWFLTHKPILLLVFAFLTVFGLAFIDFLFVRYVFSYPNAGFIEFLYGSMPFFLVGLATGALIKLVSYSLQKEIQEARIKAEQKEIEFNLLQSQLSPHFLFNVLNNLYGISMEDHKRIPPLLLKLSNLLRYSVYGAKKQLVPLKDELEYIKNYIEFEQIRISHRLRLETDIGQIINPHIRIAPLVLIVFVENAFKHAKNTLTDEIDISISLKIDDDFICLKISNSYQAEKEDDAVLAESGLGLANTIKRLEMQYGKDYELRQYKEKDRYRVNLRLQIRE